MNLREFQQSLGSAARNDRIWFPRWVRRYAASLADGGGDVRVTVDEVIAFLQSLRDTGTAAWQRLQAVRAIEAYRDLVLKTDKPSLLAIRQKLTEIAGRERQTGAQNGRVAGQEPTADDAARVVGQIDPDEPAVIQDMRAKLRLMHYSIDTERAYTGWVRRFISHCGSADLMASGEKQIESFLTEPADVSSDVSSDVRGRTASQGVPAPARKGCMPRCRTHRGAVGER